MKQEYLKTIERVRDYAKIGVVVGIALALLAGLRLLISGPDFFPTRVGLPFLAVVALYVAGGVITCVMLALFEGRARSLVSYVGLGIIVATPASALLALVLAKPWHSARDVILVTVLMAIVYGTIGGVLAWRD